MSGVSFVSEEELVDIREKRQKEWEKVRKEDDPLECPEQVHDNKTLYEKLQEQKQKKQDEWDEQHQLKNMIRGLDSDETIFLDMVSKQQEEIASRRFDEESQEIKQYRNAVSQFQSTVAVPSDIKPPGSAVSNRKSSQESGTKKSQFQLIAGAIKRKGSSDKTSQEKRSRMCDEVEKSVLICLSFVFKKHVFSLYKQRFTSRTGSESTTNSMHTGIINIEDLPISLFFNIDIDVITSSLETNIKTSQLKIEPRLKRA